MTVREAIELKIRRAVFIRSIGLLAALLIVVLLGRRTPWAVIAGALVYTAAIGLTFGLVRCPRCGKGVSGHLDKGFKGRKLRIPAAMDKCPFCAAGFGEEIRDADARRNV